jgi:glycopeptide antibiotics resistance protein
MIDCSLITFIALVLSVIVVSIVLARLGKKMSWLERSGLVGLAVYFPFVLGLTLGDIPIDDGAVSPAEWRRWANLIPFGTIGPQVAAGLESGLRQLAGNLLILVPLGLGLPMVWKRFRRLAPTLLVGFGVTLGIEISQVVISLMVGVPYRAFDVDDLILNTFGAIVGWLAWRVLFGHFQNPKAD